MARPLGVRPAPTLAAIAAACNVSLSTVSSAIRNDPRIKLQTRQRVRECAARLGYRPNLLARSLRTKTSHTFAYVFPSTLEPYRAMLVDRLYDYAFQAGYRLQFLLSQNDPGAEAVAIEQCLEFRVAGLVLTASASLSRPLPEDHPFHEVIRQHIPCVVTGPCNISQVPILQMDEMQAAYMATSHLLDRGCEQLRLLLLADEKSPEGEMRAAGFRRALRERNIEVPPDWILFRQVAFDWLHGRSEDGSYATQQYYDYRRNVDYGVEMARRAIGLSGPRPLGLVCANDQIAVAVAKHCYDTGLRVPTDVQVVGCDDTMSAELKLTTFRWDYSSVAQQVINNLLDQANGRPHAQRMLVGGQLVVRG